MLAVRRHELAMHRDGVRARSGTRNHTSLRLGTGRSGFRRTRNAIVGVGQLELNLQTLPSQHEPWHTLALALQEAARDLFGLEARPTEKALRAMAEEWSPWRSVAARILWSWYRVDKGREGVG